MSEADFFEDELYEDQDADTQHSSEEDVDEHSHPRAASFSASKPDKPGVDITGASSASQQSSTLHASLEDELGTSVPAPSPPVEVPAMNSRRPAAVISSSMMPTRTGPAYPRLGTSAPIAIPNMMNRWRTDSRSGNGQPEAASTFIPPHQLSKQDDFMFSFTGASPSAALKRERLRTRNAILRSTGFLEPGQGHVAIPAVEVTADTQVARTPVQSSLTAALTTIGEA